MSVVPFREVVPMSGTRRVCELASGIDALYMSGRVEVPERVLNGLKTAREIAEAADAPVEIEFGGVDMRIHPRGMLKYRYWLDDAFGVILITPSTNLPAVRVQPLAETLHRVGPRKVVEFYRDILESEMGPVRLSASRLDLYVDIQGWDIAVDQRHRFVRRTRNVEMHEDGEEFNGLAFGSRKTNTFYARIYNKTAELRKKGNHYVEQTWNENYNSALPVTRVEFQVGRLGLTQCRIDTVDEAIECSPGLWVHLTNEQLTFRSESSDTNRSRRPIAHEWLAVQDAELGSRAIGIERMRSDRIAADLLSLAPGATGYAAAITALRGGRTIEDAGRALVETLKEYEKRSGKRFEARVAEKLGRVSFVIPEQLR